MFSTFFVLGCLHYAAGQGCSQLSIDLNKKLDLGIEDNDVNLDGNVSFSDIKHDTEEYYDYNHDGKVTEKEWVRRWTCRYGDTQYVATYIYLVINRGLESTTVASFDIPMFRTGIPVPVFREVNRQRYVEFSTKNCVDRYLTLDEKLELNANVNDFNNDSTVNADDFLHDLQNNYDRDNDGNVTEAEWVLQWVCAYGDDGYFARYTWSEFTGGRQTIPNNFFAGDTANTIAQHKAKVRKIYETFAEEQKEADCPAKNAGHGQKENVQSFIVVAAVHVVFAVFCHI
ncbi:uncharacterized protein [Littorina saxatilis]|uniref:uncharacterized protein n=1 Tax=Littorina saxatilis TaxID=31220 RepID=UPI0038B6542A